MLLLPWFRVSGAACRHVKHNYTSTQLCGARHYDLVQDYISGIGATLRSTRPMRYFTTYAPAASHEPVTPSHQVLGSWLRGNRRRGFSPPSLKNSVVEGGCVVLYHLYVGGGVTSPIYFCRGGGGGFLSESLGVSQHITAYPSFIVGMCGGRRIHAPVRLSMCIKISLTRSV